MNQKPFLVLSFCLLVLFGYCQTESLYQGYVLRNSDILNPISYDVNLIINEDNTISGTSITYNYGSYGGDKSLIKGRLYSNNMIEIIEYEIASDHTETQLRNVCFFHIQGKLIKKKKKNIIRGAYKSYRYNGTPCLLSGNVNIKANKDKEPKKKQKKEKPEINKEEKELIENSDNLVLNKDSNSKILTKEDSFDLILYDEGLYDGDEVTVKFNSKTLMRKRKITKSKIFLPLKLAKGENTITIIATDEGRVKPNTVKVILTKNDQKIEAVSKLKKGEEAVIKVIRE